jgi:hypothetical protein
VYAWGYNGQGAVGESDVSGDVRTPSLMSGLPPTVFAVGAGAYFSLAIAAPVVPGAPTIGAVARGNGSASVPFSAPSWDGGSPITGYTASCVSSDGGATGSGGGSASPIAVSGLTNGKTYTCTVTAANTNGPGDPSAVSNSFVPATVPGAPPLVVVALTGRTASVNFSTPASDGGSPITGYSALCVSSNGGAAKSGSGPASPIPVAALSAGKTYQCYVSATNAVGNSVPSSPSNSVTVANVPGAPTAVSAVTGGASATTGPLSVSFTAPASNGGSAITGYTATCSSSNGGAVRSASGSASPITVAGATTGKSYTCAVTATNAIGTGASSTSSAAVIVGAPGAPPKVKAVSGSTGGATGTLSVTFGAAATNGAAVTSYAATCVSSNGGVTSTKTGAGSPLVVPGVTTAKSYTCTVKATNSRGAGPSSAATPAVVVGSPAAPTGVSAVKIASGQLRVTFTAGANNGAVVSSFTATCVSSNGGVTRTKTGTASPLTVITLTAGKAYTCTVNATNSRGAGLASAPSATVNA